MAVRCVHLTRGYGGQELSNLPPNTDEHSPIAQLDSVITDLTLGPQQCWGGWFRLEETSWRGVTSSASAAFPSRRRMRTEPGSTGDAATAAAPETASAEAGERRASLYPSCLQTLTFLPTFDPNVEAAAPTAAPTVAPSSPVQCLRRGPTWPRRVSAVTATTLEVIGREDEDLK